MSLTEICPTGCTDQIPKRYDFDYCEDVTRKRGYSYFILFDCSVEFTDILDMAEWDTLITAGDILLSPQGKFDKGTPTTSVAFEKPCGSNVIDEVIHPFTFTTPQVSTDYSDEEWWDTFESNHARYGFGYISCHDERIFLPKTLVESIKAGIAAPSAVPASNVGWSIKITETPDFVEGPNGKAGIWQFSGEFEERGVLVSVEIPGLLDKLQQLAA